MKLLYSAFDAGIPPRKRPKTKPVDAAAIAESSSGLTAPNSLQKKINIYNQTINKKLNQVKSCTYSVTKICLSLSQPVSLSLANKYLQIV